MNAREVSYALPCSRSWEKEDFMKNLTLTSLTIGFSVALMVGCGGGGGINSGVDQTKTGEELTEEEIAQLCEATADYVAAEVDVKDGTCRVAGLTQGILAYAISGGEEEEMQAACADAYDACLEDDTPPEQTVTCEETPESYPDCEATVAQYETCIEDRIQEMKEYADTVPTCDELTEDDLEGLGDLLEEGPPGSPESCDVVQETCPALFSE